MRHHSFVMSFYAKSSCQSLEKGLKFVELLPKSFVRALVRKYLARKIRKLLLTWIVVVCAMYTWACTGLCRAKFLSGNHSLLSIILLHTLLSLLGIPRQLVTRCGIPGYPDIPDHRPNPQNLGWVWELIQLRGPCSAASILQATLHS